jgi:hypothetical protein
MVSFRNLFTAVVALSAPIAAQAQTTPAQVVDNIRMLTTKSQALQAPAQSITIINGPLIIIGQGPFPQLIVGFQDIVTTATTAIAQMQGMPEVPAGQQSDAIFDAFREVSVILPYRIMRWLTIENSLSVSTRFCLTYSSERLGCSKPFPSLVSP